MSTWEVRSIAAGIYRVSTHRPDIEVEAVVHDPAAHHVTARVLQLGPEGERDLGIHSYSRGGAEFPLPVKESGDPVLRAYLAGDDWMGLIRGAIHGRPSSPGRHEMCKRQIDVILRRLRIGPVQDITNVTADSTTGNTP